MQVALLYIYSYIFNVTLVFKWSANGNLFIREQHT